MEVKDDLDIIGDCNDEEAQHINEQEVDEYNEVNVIFYTNAIVQPWTVMIHSFNTSVAYIAGFVGTLIKLGYSF